jgi:penicillin-binding protein 2
VIDPDATFHCQGYLDEPDRNRCLIYRHYGAGHGDVTLDDALCRSCNVYFFDAARRMGPQAIHDWAARFGLGRPTGVDIPGERAGTLPVPNSPGTPWYPGTTLQFAIGQASLAVTPLQVAQMMAAIANDGYLVTPTFVRPPAGPDDRTGRDIQLTSFTTPEPRSTRRAIPGLSPGTLQRVRAGLRLVVEDDHGTGKRVRHSEVSIAGKTGTAETGGGRPDHAWFAGYVPADEPRVAFVVVLEHGGSGGHVAGPVAHDFIQALLDFGVVRRGRMEGE